MTKGVFQGILQQSHLMWGTDLFLFLFRSDFLFFFFPLGRGESSSSEEGLQADTEQRGQLSVPSIDGIWNVKPQLENSAFWIQNQYFKIEFAQSES